MIKKNRKAAIWYVVANEEYELVNLSVLTHLQYSWIGAVVIVYSSKIAPPEIGLLSSFDKRVSEYWADFGQGYDMPVDLGGYNQIGARKYAINIACKKKCDWVIHCDADEFFVDGLGDVLLTSKADIIKTSVFHLVTRNTFWVQPNQIKYNDDGEIVFSPRLRIWRSHLYPEILQDTRNRHVNKTRNCISSFDHLSPLKTEYCSGMYHIHIHYLLLKKGWDEAKTEGFLDKEVLPDSYIDFLTNKGNPNFFIRKASLELTTDVYEMPANDGKWIVYTPLKGTAFYTDIGSIKALRKILQERKVDFAEASSQIVKQLTLIGALGSQKDTLPTILPLKEFMPVEATLLFNESCNMGCSYCYASSKPSKGEMSWEIAEAALRFVIDNAAQTDKRVASIRYLGGGEPTLSWQLVEKATSFVREYAKGKDVSIFIRLITNGTQLDASKSKWLAYNIDYVTLSFEILPDLQATLRPLYGGQNTHEKLLHTLTELRDAGVPFEIRSTVSSENATRMFEAVEFCHMLGGISEIRFEPVSGIGRAVTNGIVSPSQQTFVTEFLRARTRGIELGINVRCKMTRNIDRIGARFCETEFAVSSSGLISACHRYSRKDINGYETFHIGEYENGSFRFDLEKINSVRGISVNTFEECSTCFAKWNCAGECLSKRVSGNSINEEGSHCDIVRGILSHMVQERLDSYEALH